MKRRWDNSWLAWAVIVWMALAVSSTAGRTKAAEPKSSLDLVPADAHLYTAHLHKREMFERIAASNWWARLKRMPAAKLAWDGFQQSLAGPRGVGATMREFFADPENQELGKVALDFVSDEIFFYADERMIELVELYFLFGHSANAGSFLTALAQQSGADPQVIARLQEKMMFEPVLKNTAKIAVPRFVLGFKARDVAATERQLRRLMTLAKEALSANAPDVAERFVETKIAGKTFWTITFDGEMIPWDELPLANLGDEAAYKAFADHCRKLKMTLAVGVAHGYLLYAGGPNTEHVARLGQGPLLSARPEMEPVKKLADRKLTDISFESARARSASRLTAKSLQQTITQAKEVLALGFSEFLAKKAAEDLDDFAKDLEKLIPEPGAAVSASYFTDRGWESWLYEHGGQSYYDGSAPLKILDHVGGQPLVLVANRVQSSPLGYAMLVKWLKRSRFYMDSFVAANLSPEEQAAYRAFADKLTPLLVRLEKVTSSMYNPALDDGESALVFEARLGAKQWHPFLLPAEEELKLPLPAIVSGVKDADLLQKALGEYRTIINDTIKVLREVSEGQVPDLKLPEANVKQTPAGTIYWYAPPALVGLDKRLAPNCGVSSKAFVLSLAPQQTQHCLEATKPKLGGVLADLQGPVASVVYVDFAGLVDVAKPWVTWALRNYALPGQDAQEAKLALDTVNGAAELLRAVRSYSNVTRIEGKTMVTHSMWQFQDLPPAK